MKIKLFTTPFKILVLIFVIFFSTFLPTTKVSATGFASCTASGGNTRVSLFSNHIHHYVGQPADFAASGSTTGGGSITVTIYYGDGTSSNETSSSGALYMQRAKYYPLGNYSVYATITSSSGNCTTGTIDIEVNSSGSYTQSSYYSQSSYSGQSISCMSEESSVNEPWPCGDDGMVLIQESIQGDNNQCRIYCNSLGANVCNYEDSDGSCKARLAIGCYKNWFPDRHAGIIGSSCGGYSQAAYYSQSAYYAQAAYYTQSAYYSQSSYSGGSITCMASESAALGPWPCSDPTTYIGQSSQSSANNCMSFCNSFGGNACEWNSTTNECFAESVLGCTLGYYPDWSAGIAGQSCGYSESSYYSQSSYGTPINGVCGSANKTYPSGSTSYGSDTFCSVGSRSNCSPSGCPFPPSGSQTTWTCLGQNTGSDVSCTATNPATYSVSVTINTTVGGIVTSIPSGIFCGGTCTHSFSQDSVISLTAAPNSSYWKFSSWGGDCAFAGTNKTCSLVINSAKTVNTTFVPRVLNYIEF